VKIRIPKPVEKAAEPRRKFKMDLSAANRKKLDEERRTRAKIEAREVAHAVFSHMDDRLQSRVFELIAILRSAGIREDGRAERGVVKAFLDGLIEAVQKKESEFKKLLK